MALVNTGTSSLDMWLADGFYLVLALFYYPSSTYLIPNVLLQCIVGVNAYNDWESSNAERSTQMTFDIKFE